MAVHNLKKFIITIFVALFVFTYGCSQRKQNENSNRVIPTEKLIVVNDVIPKHNERNVDQYSFISVVFSSEIDSITLNERSFRVLQEGDIPIQGTIKYKDKIATFTPVDPLLLNTTYTAIITTNITDSFGTPLKQDYIWRFSTKNGHLILPDTKPKSLEIVTFSPQNSIINVEPSINITVEFSNEINRTTLNSASFLVQQDGGNQIAGTINYSNKIATFIPITPLPYDSTITIKITSAVKDMYDNALKSPFFWHFTTKKEEKKEPLRIIDNTPSNGSTNIEPDTIVSALFSSDINLTTLNTESFFVLRNNGSPIAGVVDYNNRLSTFSSSKILPLSSSFNAIITSHVKDVFGSSIENNYSWSFSTRDVKKFEFIDGNGSKGINPNPSKGGHGAKIIEFNRKLYAFWAEADTWVTKIAVYDNRNWKYINDNSINSCRNGGGVSHAIIFNNKLYVTWATLGTNDTICVAVYNGNDNEPQWNFVDTKSLHFDLTGQVFDPNLAVLNNKLYITWTEKNSLAVAIYNGDDSNPKWHSIIAPRKYSDYRPTSSKLFTFKNKLYILWQESRSEGSYKSTHKLWVATYNGDDSLPSWNFIGNNAEKGLNSKSNIRAHSANFALYNDKLYITWIEEPESYTPDAKEIRIATYNENEVTPLWRFVDGGKRNINSLKMARGTPQLISLNDRLYTIWEEWAVTPGAPSYLKVATFNGNESSPEWTIINNNEGINKNLLNTATNQQAIVFNDELYLVWQEYNAKDTHIIPQIRIAVGK